MDLHASTQSEARFGAYVGAMMGVIGHADRRRPLRGLLHRSVAAGRAQERGAAGGGDRALAGGGAAPIAASLCGRGAVIGRGGIGPGARIGAAGN